MRRALILYIALMFAAGGCDGGEVLAPLSDTEDADVTASDPERQEHGCYKPCSDVLDCVGDGALFGEDNWRCADSACVYLGCNSNFECEAELPETEFGYLCDRSAQEGVCVPSTCREGSCPVDWQQCIGGTCVNVHCRDDAECEARTGLGFRCQVNFNGSSVCVWDPQCEAPGDCVGAGSPAGASGVNYRCDAGQCEYLGCFSDSDCPSDPYYVWACREFSYIDVPMCDQARPCGEAADCGGDVPTLRASNFECEEGRCEHLGCLTDLECRELLASIPDPDLAVCDRSLVPPHCNVAECADASHCVPSVPSALSDENNWACTDGVCEYRSCVSNLECQEVFGAGFRCGADD